MNRLDDAARLGRLEQIRLGNDGRAAGESLDRLTRLASRLLGTPVALVSIVAEDRQVFESQTGLAEPWATRGGTPLSHSFCQHVVTASEPLVIADAREHPLVRDNPAIADLGVVAYAGIPLHVGGQCVGSFCAIDSSPRQWREEDLSLLEDLAAAAAIELELRWIMSEREHATRALAEREREFRLLAENSSDLIVRVGPTGEILYASPAARLFGHEPSDLIGRSTTEVLLPDGGASRQEVAALIDASPGSQRLEGRMLRGDGEWEWCEATVQAIRGADGRVVERQASIRSIEERRRQAAALAEALARYQALARHIPGGAVLLFDRDSRYLLAEGPVVHDLTGGVDPVGRTPSEVFPPPLGERVQGLYADALGGATGSFRAMASSGREYDVTITPIASEGAVVGGMALALDVTERARLEAERSALQDIAHAVADGTTPEGLLALVVQRVATLFGAVGAAVFRFERDGEATLLAAAPTAPEALLAERRFPLDPGTAIGRVARSGAAVVVVDYGQADDPLVRALRGLGAVGGAAAPITINRRLWGALGIGGANPERLTDETASQLARFAGLASTHIGNVEAWKALTREATTDLLTGLANRRSFAERLAVEMARARRSGRPLGLVILDVDRFKTINDDHGHLVGDHVLAALARIVEVETREVEMVARVGGEEFAVLLPETDAYGAMSAAERIRLAVARAEVPGVGKITISLGVAELHPGDDPDDLVRRADHALYRAKADGRDRTRRWAPEDGHATEPDPQGASDRSRPGM
jgi:diguanylate cyclase (GGDEF)-like protein/PAS domain S-box-containing protein